MAVVNDSADDVQVPDVTVIVPVYNTMPYLGPCLESLVSQSIGPGRLHVIAVDDGSTDGSESLLDRYAVRHPALFSVVHQPNSGGPAAPCNVGLELATGRFVFFLGSDDYLAEAALENLVRKADEWGSDVIFGRMVGMGGRYVSQLLYQRDEPDLRFPHSSLPFTLSNTKLFRRSLLEHHRIRYALDLRIGSDQPFTIEAMLRAKRISVLADQPYYYAVRRSDAANISFSAGWRHRVQDIGNVMAHVAALLEPGEERDALLHRHFAWELSKLLGEPFLGLEAHDQQRLVVEVGRLADAYLTEGVSRRLMVDARLRLRLAQSHRVVELRRVIDFIAAKQEPVLQLGNDYVSLVYPGFDELPADWFATTADSLRERLRGAVRLSRLRWDGTSLIVEAETRLHLLSADNVRMALVRVSRDRQVDEQRRVQRDEEPPSLSWSVDLAPAPSCGGEHATSGSRLCARLDLRSLIDEPDGPGRRWALRFRLGAGEQIYDLPAEGVPANVRRTRIGIRFYRLAARPDRRGRIFVRRRRVPLDHVVRAEWRRVLGHLDPRHLRRRGRRPSSSPPARG